MIPVMNLVAWSNVVPWADMRQVEQDLIISRAIVEIFSDPFLRDELRFRGGTALNKLHFPAPMRYSEDIDLVRTTAGPIGPILERVRAVLQPWLGPAKFESSIVVTTLRFRAKAEDATIPSDIRLKVEINRTETIAHDPPLEINFRVTNPWFSGAAAVRTYSQEEMLATKLRALLQRDKGRDLYDLAHGLELFEKLDVGRVAECLELYLRDSDVHISRAQAEERMFNKLKSHGFLTDLVPLLSVAEAQSLTKEKAMKAFGRVFSELVVLLPGEPWARTKEMKRTFGML
jgi:predicted nucleotidyltransferase component of viral defense system